MVANSTSSLIEFDRVSKVYGEGGTAVHALRDVTFRIDPGEFVAVMGHSGSGKSTCLNILGCLDTPSAGVYRFSDIEVGPLSLNQRARLRRHCLGFVFQGFNLLSRTTALENVELPLLYRQYPRARRVAMAERALDIVGLADRSRHHPSELSGGQQQRVAIARALVTEPQVLFADEPTGNLDTKSSHDIMTFLSDLNREHGITVVLVTHEDDVAQFARRTIRFVDGRLQPEESRQKALV